MNSSTGRSFRYAAPVARPVKPASVIGVSITRFVPNSSSSPFVILYAPWYCATSSPITKTSSSRCISSRSALLSASRTVICADAVESERDAACCSAILLGRAAAAQRRSIVVSVGTAEGVRLDGSGHVQRCADASFSEVAPRVSRPSRRRWLGFSSAILAPFAA